MRSSTSRWLLMLSTACMEPRLYSSRSERRTPFMSSARFNVAQNGTDPGARTLPGERLELVANDAQVDPELREAVVPVACALVGLLLDLAPPAAAARRRRRGRSLGRLELLLQGVD